jgi:putative heme-binding domain-containing protein
MLGKLLREPGGSAPILPALAQTIAARRDEAELAGTLGLAATLQPGMQAIVLNALAKGRKNAPRKPLAEKSARGALASLAASPVAEVRTAARALEDTFVANAADDESLLSAGQLPPVEQISDEVFRKFVVALVGPRDLKHGHEIFLQACATCHRMGNEGSEVGPDLLGQLGMAEESLLKDILMPNERIRPGFETTLVQTRDGRAMTGLLKSDDATSLTLIQAGAVDQVLLRKDVQGAAPPGSFLDAFVCGRTQAFRRRRLARLAAQQSEARHTEGRGAAITQATLQTRFPRIKVVLAQHRAPSLAPGTKKVLISH